MRWLVYLLRCRDGSLYCGATSDLSRRLAAHGRGKGSKYVRSRLPATLVYAEEHASRGAALSREALIKGLPKREKEKMAR
jgi:putative endonuclease